MSQGSFTGSEQISEEANGDAFSFLTNNDPIFGLDLNSLFDDEASFSDFPIAGTCDLPIFTGRSFDSITNEILLNLFNNVIEAPPNCAEPNEFDGYLGPLYSDHSIEYDQQRALINCSTPQLSS